MAGFMKLSTQIFALLCWVALSSSQTAKFCTSDEECNPCQGKNRFADFAFILDASGSMGYEIGLVKAGMKQFVTALDANAIDSRYAIILYGSTCELVMDWSSDLTSTLAHFDQIQSNVAVPGFSLRHFRQEAAFECICMTLAECPYSELERSFLPAPSNAAQDGLAWRNEALKYFFHVTDEDADAPYYDPNKFGTQDNVNNREPVPGFADVSDWASDRFRTAEAILKHKAYISTMNNKQDVPAEQQFGDYDSDVSKPDFTEWDPVATLQNLIGKGLQNSMQGQILSKGGFCRNFNILEIDNPDFITNFFSVAVSATTLCEGESSCFYSTCLPTGCVDEPICERLVQGVNECDRNCKIGPDCFGFADLNPTNKCEACVPGENRWGGCDDGDICTNEVCDPLVGCNSDPICTAACDRCSIDGGCYDSFGLNPNNPCQLCDPFTSESNWTDITWIKACNPDLITQVDAGDRDGDGVTDGLDICPDTYYLKISQDSDGDGIGDECDPCPSNADDVKICGAQINPKEQVCSGHGTCNCGETTTMICECDPGWFGILCENELKCEKDCNAHGACVVAGSNVETQCECEDGFDGPTCEEAICNGCINGVCKKNFQCDCSFGYVGTICNDLDPNLVYDCGNPTNDCNGNGQCVPDTLESGVCKCSPGFTGDNCEFTDEGLFVGSANIVSSVFVAFFVVFSYFV